MWVDASSPQDACEKAREKFAEGEDFDIEEEVCKEFEALESCNRQD
jgi:hypothetical protein